MKVMVACVKDKIEFSFLFLRCFFLQAVRKPQTNLISLPQTHSIQTLCLYHLCLYKLPRLRQHLLLYRSQLKHRNLLLHQSSLLRLPLLLLRFSHRKPLLPQHPYLLLSLRRCPHQHPLLFPHRLLHRSPLLHLLRVLLLTRSLSITRSSIF